MAPLKLLRRGFERFLEAIVVAIVVALTLLLMLAAIFRYAGSSLTWSDEVASIGLVWLTYYGSALAALKGAHIGFPGIVNALPRGARVAATVFSEACVFFFFAVLAWTGLEVLAVLKGDKLVTLPWVPLQVTQSVIPIGAVLFMVAEALRLPEVLREASRGELVDHELKEVLAEAEAAPSGPAVIAPAGVVQGSAVR